MKNICRFIFLICFSGVANSLYPQWTLEKNDLEKVPVISLAASDTTLVVGTYNDGVYLFNSNNDSWSEINKGLEISNPIKTTKRKTFDGGKTWETEYINKTVTPIIYSLAISNGTIYAGTSAEGLRGGGIFISSDNGLNWDSSPIDFFGISSICILDKSLIVGTYGAGVILSDLNFNKKTSENEGLPVYSGFSDFSIIYDIIVSGTNLFVATQEGIFRSTINKKVWSKINDGLPSKSSYYLGLSDTILFVGTKEGVFYSKDNGSKWISTSNGIPKKTYVNDIAAYKSNIFAGTNKGVFLSTDNGISWSDVSSGLPKVPLYALVIFGTKIIAGSKVGVWSRPLSEMISME